MLHYSSFIVAVAHTFFFVFVSSDQQCKLSCQSHISILVQLKYADTNKYILVK